MSCDSSFFFRDVSSLLLKPVCWFRASACCVHSGIRSVVALWGLRVFANLGLTNVGFRGSADLSLAVQVCLAPPCDSAALD